MCWSLLCVSESVDTAAEVSLRHVDVDEAEGLDGIPIWLNQGIHFAIVVVYQGTIVASGHGE